MKTAPGPKIDALTGARFFAALYVGLMHYTLLGFLGVPDDSSYGSLLRLWTATGGAGVGFFFVLSGFVLAYQYGDVFSERFGTSALARFYGARLARIYPLYLVALLLAAASAGWLARSLVSPWADCSPLFCGGIWLINAATLQTWFPSAWVQQLFNAPAWSIGVEFCFYAIFPFIVGPLRRFAGRRGLWTSAGIVYLLQVLLVLGASALLYPRRGDAAGWMLLLERLPLLRLGEFAFGVLACEAYRRDVPRRGTAVSSSAAVLVLLIALHGVWLLPPIEPAVGGWLGWTLDRTRAYWFCAPLFAVLIVLLARGGNPFSRLLSRPALVHLGEASYAFYILHWVPLQVLHGAQALGARISPIVGWGGLALTLLAASLAFVAFETPLRRWGRKRVSQWLARGG